MITLNVNGLNTLIKDRDCHINKERKAINNYIL